MQTISNISRVKSAQWGAFLLLLLMGFLSTGTLPLYLDYLDSDNIEISQNCETESDSEKKENNESETNKYLTELFTCSLDHLNALIALDGNLDQIYFSHFEIPTPPPEQG
jgi:hypothetical protein